MADLIFITKNVINHFAQNISYYLNKPFCLPTVVHFAPTLRCNLRCNYCDIWKEGKINNELTTQQWKKFLKDLHCWLGKSHIGITGGEPLLRKDIIELLEYMIKLKLKVSLTTNGIFLNQEIIDKLSRINIFNINISLESIDPKIHDSLRGEGTFKKTFENIIKLKQALNKNNSKTLLVIETTLTSKNIRATKELFDFCKRNKLKIHFGNVVEKLQVDYQGDFNGESEFKPTNVSKINETISFLIMHKSDIIVNSTSELRMIRDYYLGKKISFKCAANVRNLFVSSDGSVKLCQYMLSVGNINQKNVNKVWYSKKADNMRKTMKKCNKICQFDCYKKRSLYENYEMYKSMYRTRLK